MRKELKIRRGFTPQEDVRRFRGSKQQQMDAKALPKGHIIGWAPPSSATQAANEPAKPLTKSAKKNAKRKEKKAELKKPEEAVPESWDDDDEDIQDTKGQQNTPDEQDSGALAEKLEKLKVTQRDPESPSP